MRKEKLGCKRNKFWSTVGDNHIWFEICENKIIKDYHIDFSISTELRM